MSNKLKTVYKYYKMTENILKIIWIIESHANINVLWTF